VADQRKKSPRSSSRRTSRAAGTKAASGLRATAARRAGSVGAPPAGGRTAAAAARGARKASSGGGKRPPVNLWPRRIITGLGLVLIVALVGWGIVAIVRAIVGAVIPEQTPQSSPQSAQSGAVDSSGYALNGGQEATADGLLTDGTQIDIPACLERDVKVSVTASPAAAGSALPATLTLENRGAIACSTSLSNFALQVTTGDHQVYNSARCAQEQRPSTTLLLRPGGTWTGTLSWDGYVYADGCTPPEGGASAASAGTYKLAVTMGGREVGEAVVAVKPAPSPQSGPQSGTQSR